MKKLIYLALCAFSISYLAGCTGNPASGPKTFTDITFNSASFVYDGTSKSIYVSGAPEFATVTYEGNEKTNVGIYTVTAHISANNYNPLDLSATLTINRATITGVVFEDQSFDYDGQSHSIYVSGVPAGASVTYTNNDKTSVGVYAVTARINGSNYLTLTKTAAMTIVGKQITGVTFEDKTFEYDGESHSIYVSGELPAGVTVNYTNNGKIDAGTYQVTARLTGEGYNPLELKANLIITSVELDNPGYFYDKCVLYDGQNHSIEVTSNPSYTTVSYRCLNKSGANTFKEPGQYDVEATVKLNNSCLSVLKATLFIVEPAVVGVDPNKTALVIDENLTWDELHEALSHDNFTYENYSGYYDVENVGDPRPSDLFTYECEGHQLRTHFVTDGKESYSRGYSTYDDDDRYYTNTYYKEIGDDILKAYFHDDGYSTNIEKIPKVAFSETVCKSYANDAFAALKKGENGEFVSSIDFDDFYKNKGYQSIEDDKFVVLMEHYSQLKNGDYRYFYEICKFYNIGNSKVELPSSCVPSSDYLENRCAIGTYVLNVA